MSSNSDLDISNLTPSSFKVYLLVDQFEKEAFDYAIVQAKELANKKLKCSIPKASQKICQNAFNVFKEQVTTTFSTPIFQPLTALTLMSKEKLFFEDLKGRIQVILNKTPE